VILLYHVLL